MIIPILINNRDLLDCTRAAVEFFLDIPDTTIVLVDQASTYGPLLDWYLDECPVRVHALEQNTGPRGGQAVLNQVISKLPPSTVHYWFAVEPDLDYSTLPKDFLYELIDGLQKFPQVQAAGLGLRIDDIPQLDGGEERFIVETEAKFWADHPAGDLPPEHPGFAAREAMKKFHAEHPRWNLAGCDMAGVLHRSNWNGDYTGVRSTVHVVRHLPWYHTDANRPADFEYYLQHACPRGTYYTARVHTKRLERERNG